ncbi:MAG: transcriptional regulator [Acidimicrobiia bacterium]
MGQMTWRGSDELIERVRRSARRQGRSMNDYVSAVLDAATNPDLAGDEAVRLRERLARAGVLAPAGGQRRRPPKAQLSRARAAARGGVPLSQLVDDGR